jgi:transcriptional regulator with XRE-family HTH domain
LNIPVSGFRTNSKKLVLKAGMPADQIIALRNRITGVLLRQARTEAGMSQKELAQVLNVPPRRITQYEYGQRPIPVAELLEIAEALGVSMSYFLDEGVGRLGEREQTQSQFERFVELPDDVRAFVSRYTNLPHCGSHSHFGHGRGSHPQNRGRSLDIVLTGVQVSMRIPRLAA